MRRFILASNNPGKLAEMRQLLAGLDIELLAQREAGCTFAVEETGTTFAENARLKAQAVTEATGCPAIADDSGLCVAALDMAPGVYSARYGGAACPTDESRNALLLQNLDGVADRRAAFISWIVCTFPNGDSLEARGCCPGRILEAPRGTGGFGYDPIFEADATPGRSMGELSPQEKNSISHRGAALAEFSEKLRRYRHADQ